MPIPEWLKQFTRPKVIATEVQFIPIAPDPKLLERLAALETSQVEERAAREAQEQRHITEVAALQTLIEAERIGRYEEVAGLKQQIAAEVLELTVLTRKLEESEKRERQKDIAIALLESTVKTLQINAEHLTRILTDQGSEQKVLREQLAAQSERLNRQRAIIDTQSERIAVAERDGAQAREEAAFWRMLAGVILEECNDLREKLGMERHKNLEVYTAAIRAAWKREQEPSSDTSGEASESQG